MESGSVVQPWHGMVLSRRRAWAREHGVELDPIEAMYCERLEQDGGDGILGHFGTLSRGATEVTSVPQSPSYDVTS